MTTSEALTTIGLSLLVGALAGLLTRSADVTDQQDHGAVATAVDLQEAHVLAGSVAKDGLTARRRVGHPFALRPNIDTR